MNLINKHEDNAGITDPTLISKDLYVKQLGRAEVQGNTPVSNAKSSSTQAVQILRNIPNKRFRYRTFNYDSSDTIEEFSVELCKFSG